MKKKLLALSMLTAISWHANAFEVDAGDDWSVRWDNTFKYNLMIRAQNPQKEVYGTGTAQFLTADPDFSFDSAGDVVSNRLDLLSELDVIWRDNFGFRVSAAAWYDHAYSKKGDQPDSMKSHWSNPSVDIGEWNDDAKDTHYRGGEILDAFAFANFDVGDVAGNVRVGRHSLYWGQSLLLVGASHSVGGSMNTVDAMKGVSVPGSEIKELFRPTGKLSTVIQWTDNFTMEAYYSFEFEPWRLPEATSYFSPADGLTEGTEVITLAPHLGMWMEDYEASDTGEWGLNFSYYFDDSGLEVSAYYLNYSHKYQDGVLSRWDWTQALGMGLFDGTAFEPLKPVFGSLDIIRPDYGMYSIGEGKWIFPEGVELFGVSFANEYAGISFGLDLTYRHNTPLRVQLGGALAQRWGSYPAPLDGLLTSVFGPALDFEGANESNYDDYLPVGDTYHAVFNGLGLLNDNGIWEGGVYIFELTLSKFASLNNDEFGWLLLGQDGGPTSLEEGDWAAHVAFVFNPTWYQVFPGTDLTLKTSLGYGLKGSSQMAFGGDKEVGSASVGLEFNINQSWFATARWSGFFGPADHSVGARWKDRDNVAFTVKRTF